MHSSVVSSVHGVLMQRSELQYTSTTTIQNPYNSMRGYDYVIINEYKILWFEYFRRQALSQWTSHENWRHLNNISSSASQQMNALGTFMISYKGKKRQIICTVWNKSISPFRAFPDFDYVNWFSCADLWGDPIHCKECCRLFYWCCQCFSMSCSLRSHRICMYIVILLIFLFFSSLHLSMSICIVSTFF